MEKTSSFAQYAIIEDIIRGGYTRQLVRILGTLDKIEIQNRTILVESDNSQIECQIPEEFLSNISSGMYIQVYGEVIPSVPNPKILARIVRQMNTIDEESYNFAVNVFRKYIYPSK